MKDIIYYEALEKALIEVVQGAELQAREQFCTKCLQIFETAILRHSLMLVGPTKRSIYQVLRDHSEETTSLKRRRAEKFDNIVYKLNLISIPYGDLYGTYNAATNDWKNEVLMLMLRECVRDENVQKHWTIYDGPVDAYWIEDMNTVYYDSKKMRLASIQIIQLTSYMNMLFEVENLHVTCPATESRCGMLEGEFQSSYKETLRDIFML
ncbi:MAG: putative dynein heavy chain 1, axonemal protein [Streblomastix strix]|uniref:Putative dynein heavy chain 1, axonemal protein n=1 Tax=Streblomastix strix TaxID=222440 RepID=A0A5J4TMX0_9EUKA|nr:MAG: putative dynein heavy chain 1, axonemal protein [Streblomastix strix]